VRFSVPQPPKSTVLSFDLPSVSPDGTRIALTAAMSGGPRMLWIRALDSLEMHPVPGTENAFLPFWSPDSRSIAFNSGNKLLKVGADGGPVTLLSNLTTVAGGGTWSAKGVILIGSTTGPLLQLPDTGGDPKPV